MKPSAPKNTIAWAVDPFCEECPLVKQTARSVGTLASQWNAEVEPVYLLGDVPPNVRFLPILIREFQSQAQSELRHLIKGIKIPNLKELRLIAGSGSQRRAQADQLLDYAKRSQVNLIAVGTRARRGPSRWVLGSFAETLILRSDVPLFVVNPHEMPPRKFDHILFPTDFSEESRRAFAKVLDFAKEIGAQLTLFHKISYELTPSIEVALSAYPFYQEIFEQEIQAKQTELNQWARQAKDAGIETEIVVDYRMSGSVSQSILKRSRSRGEIIAIAAHSGPLSTAFLGSTTRQIVRSAKCPVWVVHTQQRGKGELPLSVTEEDIMSDLTEHGRRQKTA